MSEKFDYGAAVARLEEIARKVESAQTGLEDMDKYIKESEKLIGDCRAWLRSARDKVDALGQD